MKHIFNFLKKDEIGEPPFEYSFLYNLPESEYPKYLTKIFNYKTGKKLNLKHPKTFSEKIQWIKLYGITDLMRDCTDKVKVRDYVKEKIGEEYLKPVLQIIPNESQQAPVIANHNSILGGEAIRSIENNAQKQLDCRADVIMSLSARNDGKLEDITAYFDQINWDKLPNAFVIKTNHGSKWQYIIKNKNEVLNTKPFVDIIKRNVTGWLEQEYWVWNGFEMQYKGIKPKLIVEPLLREEIQVNPREIEVYCFKGKPKIIENVRYDKQREITYYNEDFSISDLLLNPDGRNFLLRKKADDFIKQTFVLSEALSQNFNFVRVDWLVFDNKLYFNELTFTPYSGFIKFDKTWNKKIGNWIEIV